MIEDLDVIYGDKPDVKESDADRIDGYDARGRLITGPHDHDWITRRIAIGSALYREHDVRSILGAGVTHVLDCQSVDSEKLYAGAPIQYMHCPTDDDGAHKDGRWFMRGVVFGVEVLRAHPDHKLLVHCAAGVNRSAGMTYAILRARGLSAEKARHAIKSNRRICRDTYFADADRFIAAEWRHG